MRTQPGDYQPDKCVTGEAGADSRPLNKHELLQAWIRRSCNLGWRSLTRFTKRAEEGWGLHLGPMWIENVGHRWAVGTGEESRGAYVWAGRLEDKRGHASGPVHSYRPWIMSKFYFHSHSEQLIMAVIRRPHRSMLALIGSLAWGRR